jgi:hypothetical protein
MPLMMPLLMSLLMPLLMSRLTFGGALLGDPWMTMVSVV